MKKLSSILHTAYMNVADGFKKSTRTVHEINRENFAEVRADAKANFQKATEPDPDFQRFREAKGLRGKIKVIWASIVAGAAENTAKETARRNEAQSFSSYKEMLETQRENRQATINGSM